MDSFRSKSAWSNWGQRIALMLGLVLLLFAINAAASHFLDEKRRIDLSDFVVDKVVRGDFVHDLRGIGTLVSEEVSWVSAETDGRIARIVSLPGVDVESDSLIIEMVNPDLETTVSEAESELAGARAALRTQQAILKNDLLKMKSDLVNLESEYAEAVANHEVFLDLLEENAKPKHLVELADIKKQGLKRRVDVDRDRFAAFEKSIADQLAVFDEKIKIAQTKVAQQKRKRDSLQVLASKAGVLAQVLVEEGQQVTAGDVLAKVVDPKKLKAMLKISEVQSPYLSVGQLAKIDTHHGLVSGEITRIDPEVLDASITVEVRITDKLPPESRPDLSIIGTIEVDRVHDVLHVGRPTGATSESNFSIFVVEQESNTAKRVSIRIGAASISRIEIEGGLKENDRVILSDMTRFEAVNRIELLGHFQK